MKKSGFTLIELLAVIIILAIVALISTPIILNVVDEARESANKSSVAMYADAVKLAVIDSYFENQSYPAVDDTWIENNVEYGGERISCQNIYYTQNEGVTLHECTIGGQAFNYVDDMSVSAEDTLYCYSKGKVYTDCTNSEYVVYHEAAQAGSSSIQSYIVFDNTEGINVPQLLDEMVPVKWDGVTTVVTTKDDPDWYNYSNKEWANARTKDGSYWVWVPRYAYKIGASYHTNTTTPNSISIEFLIDDTIDNVNNKIIETTGYEAGVKDTSNNYFLHPAFENSDTNYGFWVAKYEASGILSNIEIKPGETSIRNTTIGDMFDASLAMSSNNSKYGWNASETETHMMTNYEWGALAYLSYSIYGKNSEVWVNNSGTYTTGCAGSSVSDSYYNGCENGYNSILGQNASTTGNITGVYDMSGGAREYTVAYIDNSSSITNGSSIVNSTSSYKNIYTVITDSQENNYETNKNIYGDAIYETSNTYQGIAAWNEDYMYMPYSNSPWFGRGGYYSDKRFAGIFFAHPSPGSAGGGYGFRPIVSKVQS